VEIIWKKASEIIKNKISQQNYQTWIRPIKISSLSDSSIYLSVPNKFFKDWLIDNYTDIITSSLSDVIGTPVAVDFTVDHASSIQTEPSSDDISPPVPKKTRTRSPHPSINSHYSFDRFVVGTSNQFAHAAAVSVAQQPASHYNPLFIYGGVGLGKTHLLNAIGLQTLSLFPSRNILYVSAEEFMNELINSIRFDKMQKFRDKYRNIDSLLIDDIQFIAGKDRTQEEFFHTFNTLHDSGKQIVVTSDKFPKDIPNLERRLRSRFEWGLIADIQPPEIETRIAILEKKAQENGMSLPQNVAYFIASIADSNIRELEGILTRVAAFSSLTGREIDKQLVKDMIKNLVKHSSKQEITVDEILKAVALKYKVKVQDIKSSKKNKNLVLPRQVAMYLSRKLTNLSFPDIGQKIGGRDHSTVIYSNKKISKLLETDTDLQYMVEYIIDRLQTSF